ncbi:glycoside hydrolase/phage tail family protein [Devosia sp. 919]|uniref:baseplate multidomain protein megatron n=1 Tax=Devosia sp. 919 TaxID=2726065 RepID=UPI0015525B17|nr:glycoside hydrolase/phage tail family protein [Devosia sp. 919]
MALSLAGQFAGRLVGGPFGATLGRALGALAGSAVDGMLFGERAPKGAGADIRLQGSSEGGAVARLYGWGRLAGNIIWARELELLAGEGAGAKGMRQAEEDEVAASFAVAFCEGEVQHFGRIWADGQLLDPEGLTLRFYHGTEDQLPDGLIEATQGEGSAPAYRGLCYLVVEQLPLGRFGNRIPQLSVELCRVVGDLERDIRAITVIPGATEFGYDPVPRVRVLGPGTTVAENAHLSTTRSNWTLSLDELTALCPNLEHVALVVAWFGDDLRAGHCKVGPRVESADRVIEGASWSVMGLERDDVPVVSVHDGGPAYGGTPADSAVLAAIADLKARGLKVTLYPIIMMDIPVGNTLPDPYWGGTGQPSYSWRGRITCDPAPGQAGSPFGTTAAVAQAAAFFDAGFAQMARHYAELAAEVGGVDALLIGSELVGMTGLRGPGNSFPFVAKLVELAAEVRAIVGPTTKLSYAADWSEWSGVGSGGEKFFHLDPLWASPHIDAVGIDNYMPGADWRDGTGHADAALSAGGYDLDYLASHIAGGDGFDWYYASDADRQAGIRSPISDGAYHEPWVWRFKDLKAWWSNPHHDRPGGVRNGVPTAWVPASKPIWFTELGCGAVDKGANQPNIFGDEKSAESGRPFFSSGAPDPLIQRQFLRAQQRFWRDPANNPAGMVDVGRIYLWTWDARPYPAFPALDEIWADGVNHRTGHWLTGRLGGASSQELLAAVAAEHGVTLTAEPALPFVAGYLLGDASTGREAIEPVLEVSGLRLRSHVDGLHAGHPLRGEAVRIEPDALVRAEGPVLSRRRGDSAEAPGRLALSYLDRERDYLTGTVTAMRSGAGPLSGQSVALVLDGAGARVAAETLLGAAAAQRETLTFTLAPDQLALEPGDLVQIAGLAEGPFEISEIRDGLARQVTARTLPHPMPVTTVGEQRAPASQAVQARALPLVLAAQLPGLGPDPLATRLVIGAFARPWPGVITVADEVTGAPVAQLPRAAVLGELVASLPAAADGLWDDTSTVELRLHGGHLASAAEGAVLAGANQLAVQSQAGTWKIIGFAQAELLSAGHFRLHRLLRGQAGTAGTMGDTPAGAPAMLLDGRVGRVELERQWLGQERLLRCYAGAGDLTGTELDVAVTSAPALPLPPAELTAERDSATGAIVLHWRPRHRLDANGGQGFAPSPDHLPEAYRITIRAGTAVRRVVETGAAQWSYPLADQLSDWGGPVAQFQFSVCQLSAVLGEGHKAEGVFGG